MIRRTLSTWWTTIVEKIAGKISGGRRNDWLDTWLLVIGTLFLMIGLMAAMYYFVLAFVTIGRSIT